MNIIDITADPIVASAKVFLTDGIEVAIRPLLKSDQQMFGEFLSSLSPTTNLLYQPHALTKEAAQNICENLDYSVVLPFVAITTTGEVVAYFILDFRYTEHETNRYKQYGITINPTEDCRFAPVVADKYQGMGIGKLVFRELLLIISQLPLRSLILSGGTQEGNKRAIAFYERSGFKLMGEFEENGMRNYDMMLALRK